MSCRALLMLLTLACFGWVSVLPAAAQTARTIRVSGAGTVSASPNFVIVRGSLAQTADSAKEAMEKFNNAKEKLAKVLAAETRPELNVEFAGEKLASGTPSAGGAAAAVAAFGGGGAGAEKTNYAVSENIAIRMKIESDMQQTGIVKKLSGMIDDAAKAGLSFGAAGSNVYARMGLAASQGIVQFEMDEDHRRQVHAEAYQAAFADARTRGETLAKLAGGRLGKAIAIEEKLEASEAESLQAAQIGLVSRMLGGDAIADDGTIDHNGRIEVQQRLVVTFQLID